ncbi:MAG: putative SEC1 family transport protein SLY1 [Streblomastix strix]|uniref:Putative SEC1 family transport protein SLY1 n=1 Tax=Streblomastix strix TaxID=222440 RepID=A0A5J4X8Y8_9EUKA|nr:MAG: putative SEC1 family transport protein SLY1 [Streblomastix strix]
MFSRFSVKVKQIEALKSILRLNKDPLEEAKKANADVIEIWKVLIYDQFAKTIVSPLLSTNSLRSLGVTLLLDLTSRRQPVPSVPVIYIFKPTDENLNLIYQDAKENLYDYMHLNFTSSIRTETLQSFAGKCAKDRVDSKIVKVYEHFLDFVSYEHNLFSLWHENSFNKLNSQDSSRREYMQKTAAQLANVLYTLGTMPIIKYSESENAQYLSKYLAEALRSESSPFSILQKQGSSSIISSSSSAPRLSNAYTQMAMPSFQDYERPLLIIIERSADIVTALQHHWTYMDLISDLLDYQPGRINYTKKVQTQSSSSSSSTTSQTTKQHFDVSFDDDFFWVENFNAPFDTIGPQVTNLVSKYTVDAERIKGQIMNGIGDGESNEGMGIGGALDPLTATKSVLDKHVLIATQLNEIVKKRSIDIYSAYEEELRSGNSNGRIFDILNADKAYSDQAPLIEKEGQQSSSPQEQPNQGTLADMIRLLSVAYLSPQPVIQRSNRDGENESWTSQIDGMEQKLKRNGAPYIRSYEYLKRFKNRNADRPESSGKIFKNMTELFSSSIKLPYVERLVEDVMDAKQSDLADSLITIDPKQSEIPISSAVSRDSTMKVKSRRAIVFIIGGATIHEYLLLADYAKRTSREIILGSTEILTPLSFLQQLQLLQQQQ